MLRMSVGRLQFPIPELRTGNNNQLIRNDLRFPAGYPFIKHCIEKFFISCSTWLIM